jgi:hypothetical protein
MSGRPLKFSSVEEITPLIEKYFNDTPIEEWTITGLALALDTSRTTLIDYCNRAEDPENEKVSIEFANTIKRPRRKWNILTRSILRNQGVLELSLRSRILTGKINQK